MSVTTPQSQITVTKQDPGVDETQPPSISMDGSFKKKQSMDSRRDTLFRRHALDVSDTQNLKSYVRYRRDSIVQHVIGYNYDDHSTAGGLYTRVGIGSKMTEFSFIN